MEKVKKIAIIFLKAILSISNIILLAISIAFIVFLVYFFQTSIYTSFPSKIDPSIVQTDDVGGNSFGNDATSAYGYIVWMDKYFPSLPFWFPEQGAGVSFTSGYQWLAHYMVVAVHHFTNINLQMSFSLVKDASFLLSAIGIILICFFRLEYPKQKPIRILIGLIAVYFYLVSPISRYWTDKWGFFAEGVSYMFVAPAVIFLDWFIDLSFKKITTWQKRLALICAAIFYALAYHTHFMTGLAITNIFAMLLIIKTLIQSFKTGVDAFKTAGIVILSVAICTFILFGWRFFQFRDYGIQTSKGGSSVNLITVGPSDPTKIFKFEKLEGNFPTLKQTLGIETIDFPDQRFVFQGYFMPPYVWFFVLCGLILGWIRSRKIIAFAILAVWGFFAYSPNESGVIGYFVQFVTNTTGGAGAMFFGNRPAWAAARLLAPITAAYGIFMLIDVLLILPDFITKKISPFLDVPWKYILRPLIVVPAMIWIFITTIYSIDYQNKLGPIDIPKKDSIQKVYNSQYPYQVYFGNRKVDLTNIWQSDNQIENPITQLDPSNWPKLDLDQNPFGDFSEDLSFSHIEQRPLYSRMDISGLSGSLVMRAPLLTEVSTTQAYVANLILFSGLQNFQTAVMYVDYPIYQRNNILSELAKWFGYQYVLAETNSNTAKILYDDNPEWERLEIGNWYRFKNHAGLATWTERPSVLFIGNQDKFLYDQFLKNASVGTLSYDDAILFNGTNQIDDYSLDELKKFPLIVMSGYKYRDQNSAYDLIEKYVKQGGSIFIDTGWQFNNPDWQGKKLPPYFPTNGLEWKTLPLKSQFVLDNTKEINFQPETNQLGETGIRGSQWASSVAQDVREDGKVIVQSNGSPVLMTKSYGKGKVVWSGYNIVAYIEGNHNENQQQIQLLKSLFTWLLPKKSPDTEIESKFQITRQNPDHLTFTLQDEKNVPSILYWREAYHPKWHAYLKNPDNKKTELKVYTAGPRFMGIKLPPIKKDSEIELKIEQTPSEITVIIVSIIATIFLFLHLFRVPEIIWTKISSKFKRKLKTIQKSTPEVITEENREATEEFE